MNKQELLTGKEFTFSNEEHQNNIKSDDIRNAIVWFDFSGGWYGGFKIEFNGMLLHKSQTFTSMQTRLNKLIKDWNLKEIN